MQFRLLGAFVFAALVCCACSHVVILKTDPPGATVWMNDEIIGVTPTFYEEATGPGRHYELRLTLEGYRSEHLTINQNVWWPGCIWPSLCLIPFTCGTSAFGLLFARSLEDEYTFLLRPISASTPSTAPAQMAPIPSSAPASSLPAATAPQNADTNATHTSETEHADSQ